MKETRKEERAHGIKKKIRKDIRKKKARKVISEREKK